ncbi:MAG TPA: TIGR03084 family metal-binding protein [Acidimicrobiia bacterium]|jgi:uncharacterized protein (TIGR03084 family)|nr:TIGR03084 family metal-binding protein [Acidimicrobiia bacterium]
MADLMAAICDDLEAEKASVVALVAPLDESGWDIETPAPPWTIRDQVSHLAFFDEKALLAHADPEAFLAELADGRAAEVIDRQLEQGRSMSGRELLAWWDRANADLTAVYRTLDPKERVVWYGPPMAARSKITARIMETWAHGQDVADALAVVRSPTDRLRHVCHIGVRARSFAYIANGLVPPQIDVFVSLEAPDGSRWEWGEPGSEQRVSGSALGFALLVTQRRHRDDVDVRSVGDTAEQWMSIAQAFAGPPGEGRVAGQFAHVDGAA